MKKYVLVYKNGICIADRVEVGNSFFKRFKGLMGRKALLKNQGFYLKPCRSIHTFQMRFAIDVLFLSKQGVVLDIVQNMQPWKLRTASKNTVSTLELPADTTKKYGINLGDKLVLVKQEMG